MARNIVIETIRARAQARVDLVNDNRLSTTNWNQFISEVLGELYSEISQTGDRYFETAVTVNTDGSASYELSTTLSTNALFIVGVDRVLSSGQRWALYELEADERNRYSLSSGSDAYAYSLVNDALTLYPTPPSGQTYSLLYIPQPTDHSATGDGTSIDVVSPAGEKFLLWGVAALARSSGQEDARLELEQKDRARADVIMEACNRRLRSPPRRMVSDAPDFSDYLPGDWWPR